MESTGWTLQQVHVHTHTLPRSWCLLTVVFQTLVCVFSILHSELAHLVRVLASALHAVGMELILVIPAPKGGSGNTHLPQKIMFN